MRNNIGVGRDDFHNNLLNEHGLRRVQRAFSQAMGLAGYFWFNHGKGLGEVNRIPEVFLLVSFCGMIEKGKFYQRVFEVKKGGARFMSQASNDRL
ncbi:MAG: hypothetical protein K6T85_00080 [Gorillibacterium sp.]|nr:hypothetical protein [Gorillibacterium sp.]